MLFLQNVHQKKKLIFAPRGLLTCLEMGMATIPKFYTNLNSVPMIFVLKIQNDLSTRTQLILSTETMLSTNGGLPYHY
jgi:quinolinate synthase